MSGLTTDADELVRSAGRRKIIAIGVAAGLFVAAAMILTALSLADPAHWGGSDPSRLLILAIWGAIFAAYAVQRYRPAPPYDSETLMRPRAEAFQTKRARLLMLNAMFVGLAMTPLMVMIVTDLKPTATVVDRLYDAVVFLAPCAVTLGLMTGLAHSKAVGAAVDDELTAANRARALGLGFAVFAGLSALALIIAMLRPAWALAASVPPIGLGVAAAGARFARLEQTSAVEGSA